MVYEASQFYTLLYEFLILILGLGIIVIAANFVVKYASAIAKYFGISTVLIGMAIVGFGTTIPELSIGIFASFSKTGDIIVGNVVGSLIFNIGFIVGLSAFLLTINLKKENIAKNNILSLLLITSFFIFVVLAIGHISRLFGIFIIFLIFLYLYYNKINIPIVELYNNVNNISHSVKKYIAFLIIAVVLVALGSKMVVNAATNVASIMNISNWVIGAVLIAVGTSLPELSISIMSAIKKEVGLFIGDIIGANISNILVVLGVASLIRPLNLRVFPLAELLFIFALTLLFVVGLLKKEISRIEGLIYLELYALYIYYTVF